MTNLINSQTDEYGTYINFMADDAKRIIYFNGMDFSGDTTSCEICLDGTVGESGLSLGDIIQVDADEFNVSYTLAKAPNHNIKLVRN